MTPGEVRRAGWILIDTWSALGADYADYDMVWQAKEYLFDAADRLESAQAEAKMRT